MKAQEGKIYALIQDGVVLQIFDKSDIAEWNEENILCVELGEDDMEWVGVGDKYDTSKKAFMPPTLEEAKEQQLHYINNRFDSEMNAFKAQYTPQDEFASWETQAKEAKAYLQSKDTADAPYLSLIAQGRGMELEALAQKVMEKNTTYNQKLYTLIGYRQSLIKALEKAQNIAQVAEISYKSPYGFE